MSKLPYIPGQRWVSSTEPEAGLGIVVDCAHRRVEVSFPAIGEQRVYAVDTAPLNRVQYREGDRVRTSEGVSLTVVDLVEQGGRFFYLCADGNAERVLLDELDLDSFVHFSKPQDRLFSGQVDSLARYRLRRQTLEFQRRLQQVATPGLLGARVQLLPHQFYIASEVAARHAPRVLLADEVGLGKTIEAGLIVHQQLITGRASRVLVVVPDSLVHQWLVEMLRRFNLMFTILDEERCQGLGGAEGDDLADIEGVAEEPPNPFESAQLVLCSLSFLVENPDRRAQACSAGWDLMVVDEAHHLYWSEQDASPEYQAVEQLAAQVQGLLLLTATPEQLGLESHFARLKLLDPARYHDLEAFREEEKSYQAVRELVEKLLAEDAVANLAKDDSLFRELEGYLGQEATIRLREQIAYDLDHQEIARAIDDLVRSLVDRHGTGRVLFRNTRDAVAGFPDRSLNSYPLPLPTSLENAKGSALEAIQPERLLGEAWLTTDPRVPWLVEWLSDLRDDSGDLEKALVICASAATAQALEHHLNVRQGIRSAVFHEGMSLVARDRAAAYFADDEQAAQVLVCSEIGSEGRNFQFVRHLVLFDLPLNPDLLEQRIGRLDRIGQKHTVQIHVPHFDSGATHTLMRWYHDGLNAFERVCPVGSAIYEQVGDQLENCLASGSEADTDALVASTRTLAEEALAELQKGRDRLLELSSCNPVVAQQVIDAVRDAESPQLLADFMEAVFDQFGVEHSYHSADATIIAPGDHMACESFPGLLEEGMTVTLNRLKALSREDMHFLSWEHPMVTGVMDMILGGDFGNATLCTLKLPPLKPGTLLLETTFALHCPAPRRLQIHRFLPLTTQRVVLDVTGKDLTGILNPEHFDKLGKKVDKATASDVIRHARPQISDLVQRCEAMVAEKHREAVGGDAAELAIAAMEKHQQRELERLQALARVNPNIRQQELDHIDQTTAELRAAMASAEWRLDAIRVAITL